MSGMTDGVIGQKQISKVTKRRNLLLAFSVSVNVIQMWDIMCEKQKRQIMSEIFLMSQDHIAFIDKNVVTKCVTIFS